MFNLFKKGIELISTLNKYTKSIHIFEIFTLHY